MSDHLPDDAWPAEPGVPASDGNRVHIGCGWDAALADLKGPGRRWLVTPWVNSGDTDLRELLAVMLPGDRLILRARPEDFLHHLSSLSAVDQFRQRGVEVGCVSHLHAKVYVREDPAAPVVWLGSANLTRRGRHGDLRAHSNYEAMSGPHPLSATQLARLEALWQESRPYDRAGLERELIRLRDDEQTYRSQLTTDALATLTLQVGFRLLRGQLTVPARWLGMAERQGVSFPAVRFVAGTHPLTRELTRLRSQLLRQLGDLAVPVDGAEQLYVVPVWKQPLIERVLMAFQEQMRRDLGAQFTAAHGGLRDAFLGRFLGAFVEFSNDKYPSAWPLEAVLPLAGQAFDDYVARDPFGITAQFAVPMPNASDPYDPLFQAVVRARQQPRPPGDDPALRPSPQ